MSCDCRDCRSDARIRGEYEAAKAALAEAKAARESAWTTFTHGWERRRDESLRAERRAEATYEHAAQLMRGVRISHAMDRREAIE